jgi:RHH-type proline utilization regulon transcriptional repressor/proline dehydrogenase/delta 1-pyrroline-5-carboxylate dehydrogenase
VHTADEREVARGARRRAGISPSSASAPGAAVELIERIRGAGNPGLMEMFLAEYGLSTNEGIALMCLAEALCACPTPAPSTR